MSIVQTVLSSAHFTVMTQDCSYPRVNCGHGEGEPGRFLLTRRGAFSIQVGSQTCLARPGQAVFLGRGVEYRVTHPDHRGCACCTDVWLDEAWLEALGLDDNHAPACLDIQHDLHLQQAHVEMLLGMRGRPDALEAEEAMLAVLDERLIEVGDAPKRLSKEKVPAIVGDRRARYLARAALPKMIKVTKVSPEELKKTVRPVPGREWRNLQGA